MGEESKKRGKGNLQNEHAITDAMLKGITKGEKRSQIKLKKERESKAADRNGFSGKERRWGPTRRPFEHESKRRNKGLGEKNKKRGRLIPFIGRNQQEEWTRKTELTGRELRKKRKKIKRSLRGVRLPGLTDIGKKQGPR